MDKKLKTDKELQELKRLVIIGSVSALLSLATVFGTLGASCSRELPQIEGDAQPAYTQGEAQSINNQQGNVVEDKQILERLSIQELREVELPTYQQYFTENGKRDLYDCVEEEEVLKYCIQLKYALEDYYKSLGASDWCEPNKDKFWFDDIEYIITAVAYKESTYRANLPPNSKDCSGITCLKKDDCLKSLRGWLGNTSIWGSNMPDLSFDENKVDVLDAKTCLEYTFLMFGFNCRNMLQEGRHFTIDGKTYCLSDKLEYADDTVTKLAIASHLFGPGNVAKATYGIQENGDTINEYLNSAYVKGVLAKAQELKLLYGGKYEIEGKEKVAGLSQ